MRSWAATTSRIGGSTSRLTPPSCGTCPRPPPPMAIAASGAQSCRLAALLGDALIAVEPDAELVSQFGDEGGAGKRVVGQLPLCYDEDRDRAVERAHGLFRWFDGGWKVNAELPGTDAFAGCIEVRATRGCCRVHPLWQQRGRGRACSTQVHGGRLHRRGARADRGPGPGAIPAMGGGRSFFQRSGIEFPPATADHRAQMSRSPSSVRP